MQHYQLPFPVTNSALGAFSCQPRHLRKVCMLVVFHPASPRQRWIKDGYLVLFDGFWCFRVACSCLTHDQGNGFEPKLCQTTVACCYIIKTQYSPGGLTLNLPGQFCHAKNSVKIIWAFLTSTSGKALP